VPWWWASYEVLRGFGFSTVGNAADTAPLCQSAVSNQYENIRQMVIAWGFSQYYRFVDEGEYFLIAMDPNAHYCVDSGEEF